MKVSLAILGHPLFYCPIDEFNDLEYTIPKVELINKDKSFDLLKSPNVFPSSFNQ